MNGRRTEERPRPAVMAGRGPAVRAEYRLKLPADGRILSAGFLGEHYRPFPPGASVVLDAGSATAMTVEQARFIGRSLAHCSEITISGTADHSARGRVDDFGLIHGLDAIANVISQAAHAFAMERRK
ncbi:hypothetical protein J7E87_19920 [Streptomyces sp. ISL-1]|uniref:hypothetical protein n=1 Tax=Streptomyces sp. ISL-1 TaxID=2817657 RepID=UPI001BECCCE9|nr:hypothetical protein [Streptomyces sp. ISL-1]MBT2391638.1 hypothetical protein [Streptomyces sp. ISL-1]